MLNRYAMPAILALTLTTIAFANNEKGDAPADIGVECGQIKNGLLLEQYYRWRFPECGEWEHEWLCPEGEDAYFYKLTLNGDDYWAETCCGDGEIGFVKIVLPTKEEPELTLIMLCI